MKNHIKDEKTGLSYTLQGDYYLPDLALPAEEEQPIGIWGCWSPVATSAEGRSTDRAGRRDQRHLRYLRQHKRLLYTNLLTSCKLNGYLADIDRQAEELFSRLVKQMADREGVTEALKAQDQMAWIGKMNNIRSRATEIVNEEIIYG